MLPPKQVQRLTLARRALAQVMLKPQCCKLQVANTKRQLTMAPLGIMSPMWDCCTKTMARAAMWIAETATSLSTSKRVWSTTSRRLTSRTSQSTVGSVGQRLARLTIITVTRLRPERNTFRISKALSWRSTSRRQRIIKSCCRIWHPRWNRVSRRWCLNHSFGSLITSWLSSSIQVQRINIEERAVSSL